MKIGNIIDCLIKYLYLSYMTVCSTSLLVTVYMIKVKYEIWAVCPAIDRLMDIITVLVVPVLMSAASVFITRYFRDKDSINNKVKTLSPANNDYLSVYVGYFFVALSIPDSSGSVDWLTLLSLYGLISAFILFSKVYYFNPILFFFGYSFYNVETTNGVRLFIISRRYISKGTTEITFPKLKRITNLVYLEYN